MRAAYIHQLGSYHEIMFGELPDPEPGPTDVLVDVSATTVNPVDTFVRSGVYRTHLPFPFVIGRDMVGTVAATGPNIHEFQVGDRVWCNSLGHAGRQGPTAEKAIVPVNRLYRVPDSVRSTDVVALAHPAATAHLALFAHGRVQPGETVVITGAGGNVGSALVALASEAGTKVIATASAQDAEYCRSLGADTVLDYRDPDLHAKTAESASNGVNLHIDTYGGHDLETTVQQLAHRGRIVILAGVNSRPTLPCGPFFMKDASIHGFVISQATTDELAQAAVTINRLLAKGKLRPRATETLPISAAKEAHRRMESGALHGKRMVLMTE